MEGATTISKSGPVRGKMTSTITIEREGAEPVMVEIRRLRNSEKTNILSVAGGDRFRTTAISCRSAIAAASGPVIAADSGVPIALAFEKAPIIGAIASQEFFDALTDDEIATISAFAFEGLTIEQKKA